MLLAWQELVLLGPEHLEYLANKDHQLDMEEAAMAKAVLMDKEAHMDKVVELDLMAKEAVLMVKADQDQDQEHIELANLDNTVNPLNMAKQVNMDNNQDNQDNQVNQVNQDNQVKVEADSLHPTDQQAGMEEVAQVEVEQEGDLWKYHSWI